MTKFASISVAKFQKIQRRQKGKTKTHLPSLTTVPFSPSSRVSSPQSHALKIDLRNNADYNKQDGEPDNPQIKQCLYTKQYQF